MIRYERVRGEPTHWNVFREGRSGDQEPIAYCRSTETLRAALRLYSLVSTPDWSAA